MAGADTGHGQAPVSFRPQGLRKPGTGATRSALAWKGEPARAASLRATPLQGPASALLKASRRRSDLDASANSIRPADLFRPTVGRAPPDKNDTKGYAEGGRRAWIGDAELDVPLVTAEGRADRFQEAGTENFHPVLSPTARPLAGVLCQEQFGKEWMAV